MPDAGRKLLVLAGAALLLCGLPACGRDKPRVGDVPRSAEEALDRVALNLERLNEPLICRGVVSIVFRTEDGATRRFLGHPTTLVFAQPQNLFFDIRDTLGGSVARVGSNQERYWLWVDVPDLRKLIWGSWSRVEELQPGQLTFPPNDLLDALCLRPLPVSTPLRPAALRIAGEYQEDQRLVCTRIADNGQVLGLREVVLSPSEPYQPVRIVDYGVDGRVEMEAELGDYKAVEGSRALTPRRYVVRWPASGAELRLDIREARLQPDASTGLFEFPARWNGQVEQLDEPGGPPPAMAPSSGRETP